MQTLTQEEFKKIYGENGLKTVLANSNTTTPTQTSSTGLIDNVSSDIANRSTKVGDILNRKDTGIITKGVQTFGQGAGMAANVIEQVANKIPGVEQATKAVGTGINWLATSNLSPIKHLGDIIGSNKALQEATRLYDTDTNFKDSVDAVTNIARLGGDVSVAMDAANFTTNVTKKLTNSVKNITPEITGAITNTSKKVVGATEHVIKDVVPSLDKIANEEVTKALQLTAGDVKNIEASTGNVVGRFMADKNLIGNNLSETQKLVKDYFKINYDTVRTEISKVKDIYTQSQVPRFTQALTELKNQVSGVAGQELKLKEIDNLLKKKQVSLNDVQRVKELVDNTYNLYSVMGDVKEGVAKQGFANMRSEMKKFIESKVKKITGTDISQLNNNVSTSKAIMDAAELRSTSGLTKSNFKIGDLGIFGIGSFVNPLFGAALLFAKKVIESPSMRFRIAKFVDGISDARKLKLQQDLSKGVVPEELKKLSQ